MALIACPECGRQVSTQAAACPNCGAPLKSAGPGPAITPGLLGRLAAVLGAWLVAPWVVRLLAFLAGIAMLIVMFRSGK